ncbi:UNVERIFIED_CONTAM: Monocopper oxidase-like protein SKS1 [Sesamum angustifolium]|uniref:Monocopper oxidase-like protein SKS1 n=1 Tax=Sesamum angustifolium TaxID=2727405 RepID=A0AAW2KLJ8_9LAMI
MQAVIIIFVASARFVNQSRWQRVTGVAVLHYSNSKGKVAGPLPDPPNDAYDASYSLNQAMSIRFLSELDVMQVSFHIDQAKCECKWSSNPQGSFHYGSINVVYVKVCRRGINGKLRATYNGISFVNPDTPIRLADVYKVKGAYKLDFPSKPLDRSPRVDRSIVNATYKGFIEIILQNNDTVVQTFHLDGYSFFVVGMGYGEWTENNRDSYNKWDAISRSTVQVFAGGWTAVYVSLDNVGVWNLRTENLDRWYLGQETYMRIINPEDHSNKTELPVPDNALYCGALSRMQKPQKISSDSTLLACSKLFVILMVVFSPMISGLS